MKTIVLRSTDGLNFNLVHEVTLAVGSDYQEVKPFGTTGFVATGPGGLNVSTNDGVTWTRTAMTTYPTNLRSNGSRVIGSRKTKLISGSTFGNEPWYSDDGVTWTKCTINQYRDPGAQRYWRVRVLISNDAANDTEINELAIYNGATKYTTYTKSSPAGIVTNIDDGNDATVWNAAPVHVAAGNAYVMFDLSTAGAVTAVEVKAGANPGRAPNCLEIEYSSDGVNWFPSWYEDNHTWAANQLKRMERNS